MVEYADTRALVWLATGRHNAAERPRAWWERLHRLERDPSDWGGLYFPAEGQWITEPDAKALAAALTRALPDVPEHDALGLKAVPVEPVDPRFDTAWGRKVAVGTSVNPFEEFSGPNKPTLGGFITHCRDCSANGGLWLL